MEQLVPQLRIGTPAQKGSLEPLISCATGKESTEMTAHLPLTPETAYLPMLLETSLPRSTPNDWKYSRLQVTARQSSLRRPSTCAKTHATGGALTSANAM